MSDMAYAITRENVEAAQRPQAPPRYVEGKGVQRERKAVARHNRRPSNRKRP